MRGLWLLALATGWVGLTLGSDAASAELSWQGIASCPDREELVYRVERALGEPLSRAAPLRFDVSVSPARSGVEARLEVSGGVIQEGRERIVGAPDCERLVDAVALTIALALGEAEPGASMEDESLPSAKSALARAAQTEQPSRAGEDAIPGDAAAALEEPRAVPALGVSLWLIGDAGSLPSAGLGAAFGLELGWQQIQLRAAATLLFEQHVDANVTAEPASDVFGAAGADLGLALGSIAACIAPYGSFRSPPSVALCAGWEMGRLSGTGTGVPEARSGGALWQAPRVELGGLWALPGTQLRVGGFLAAAAPLGRSEFVLRDIGRVHRATKVVGRVGLGLVWVLE